MIVFQQQKKKKKKKLFYHERIKKSCVIKEAKAKNKIQYFIKIISLPLIKKLKFDLSLPLLF